MSTGNEDRVEQEPQINTRKMTEGEWLVGINFNPGDKSSVDEIKACTAHLIDYTKAHGKDSRTAALAATAFEEAAMWAVKSVTKGPR